MGIGFVFVISGVLKKVGLSFKDMDLVEVNEVFVFQYLVVEKSLDFDISKINVNGGFIVLGYLLGGFGLRIIVYLVYELRC